MCTAVSFTTKNHYFGRNLDLERSYEETVTVTPRNFPLAFRRMGRRPYHYAMIGMAHVSEGYPLYYDAVNEAGLGMAGLSFPRSARYQPTKAGMDDLAPFELIPWILCQCASVKEARPLLRRLNVWGADFSPHLPRTPLHWMLSDQKETVVLEPREDGLHLYDDPVGVLTNEPPFEDQMTRLADFAFLGSRPPEQNLCPGVELPLYSKGMGAMGLPGDLSSPSRFVKAVFTRCHSVSGQTEPESVSQFFHILGSVVQQRGCVRLEDGKQEITVYSSCCNTHRGIYYYTTYENSQITAVDMRREDLCGERLISYPLRYGQRIFRQNGGGDGCNPTGFSVQ